MIPSTPSSQSDAEQAIASLIERLRDTEQRLEELTAGEVDSVASSDGRTFLLRRAQLNLRQSEGAKQAAILNALPAQVALLDTRGVIVAVNKAWSNFADAGLLRGVPHELGANYLLACDQARGAGAVDAHHAALGIRRVLEGAERVMSLTYACHSPDEQRWYQMTVTALSDNQHGAVVMHTDVTAQRLSDEALDASDQRFRQMAENIEDVFFLNEVGSNRVLYVSPAYEEIWGRSCADLYANPEAWTDAIHPDDRPNAERQYALGILGQAFEQEFRIVRPDGAIRVIEARGFPVADAHGNTIRIAGVAEDVTERNRLELSVNEAAIERRSAEERQREGEALLRIAGSTAHLGGWAVRAADQSVTWSEEVCHILEVPPGTVPELDQALSFYPLASRSKVTLALEACLQHGTAFDLELEMLTAKGRAICVRCAGEPRRNQLGEITQAHGALQDITDKKRAETALGESERRFSHMLSNVQLVSVMLDAAGLITYCNDFFLRLTGWRSSEVMGRDWFELCVPQDQRELRQVFAVSLVEPPPSWHRENEIITRSGERRLIRWNISTLRSTTGVVTGTASIGEDITERNRAEISIKHLNRVYTVLSGINTLIVRVRDREELFREACRIAVDAGGFRMSMICLVDPDTRKIIQVASAGKNAELIASVRELLASPESAAHTRVAEAIRKKKPVVSNDWLNDRGPVLQQKYLQAGVRSLAVIPLIVADEATGVFALYAREADFFHEEELKLLLELADDIAFAIDHIDKGERLSRLAYYDSLTGLANRVLFHERLTQRVEHAGIHDSRVALVLLDIERFRIINDTFGREAGDALLKAVAARMVACAADVSWLARIDGDHFAVLVPELRAEELARRIEQRVVDIFGEPFRVAETELRLSARFGVAMFPNDGMDADALFRNAEAALKNAKADGERYLFYTNSMNERVAEKLVLENHLREAIERQEFVLHYQPKFDLVSGKLAGCEALIRWNDPRTGLVPPGKFIPILEETGLIFEVGRWALRQALADGLRWRNAGLPTVRVAVNVSPLQLRNRGFVAEIRQLIGVDRSAAECLELEITEGMIIEDLKNSIATLQEIRAMGITVAIDDFGTGFSSLSYLARLPVDTLKIDRSFVNDMNSGPVGLSLVSTIITLAHSVKLKVVAEGVETPEQLRLLGLLKCDEIQGFIFSKPLPRETFEAKFLAPAGAG